MEGKNHWDVGRKNPCQFASNRDPFFASNRDPC